MRTQGAPNRRSPNIGLAFRSNDREVRVIDRRTGRLNYKRPRKLHSKQRRFKANLLLTTLRFKGMPRERPNLFTSLTGHLVVSYTRITRRVTCNFARQGLLDLVKLFLDIQRDVHTCPVKILFLPRSHRYNLALVLNLFHDTHAGRLLLHRRRDTPLDQHGLPSADSNDLHDHEDRDLRFPLLFNRYRRFRSSTPFSYMHLSAVIGARLYKLFL